MTNTAIATAITQVKGSTQIGVIIQATTIVKANYAIIIAALQTATLAISASTIGAVGGVVGAIQGLTQNEVDIIIQDLQEALALLKNVQASAQVTVTNLTPSVKAALKAELNLLISTVAPFVAPLVALSAAVTSASATVRVTVTGLADVTAGLVDSATSFATGIV
jgi:hypothetical protein